MTDLAWHHVNPVTMVEDHWDGISEVLRMSYAMQLAAAVRKLTNDLGYANQRIAYLQSQIDERIMSETRTPDENISVPDRAGLGRQVFEKKPNW